MEDIGYKEIQKELEIIHLRVIENYTALDIPTQQEELNNLEKETSKEEFWQDIERSTRVNQQISKLKKKIEPWNTLKKEVSEAKDLFAMALSEDDTDILDEISDKIKTFQQHYEELEALELLSDKDDGKNAFITIHPGAGGTESQDWANMLLRMYMRWAEDNDYDIDVIDYVPGEEAGIKDATVLISGENSYGLLKSERGIHRLVRISPFDANKRRHTSFASVEITPEITDDIEININESELRIDTYRASGAGGQHVNKTDSAVRITHLATGIVVQCQNERSQHKNKAFAMKVLQSRLYELKKKEIEDNKSQKMGAKKDISWGNQIRSYVFQPYTMVKDHRTGEETGNIDSVLDGSLNSFIYSYLRNQKKVNR